jgi:hypothetical protein
MDELIVAFFVGNVETVFLSDITTLPIKGLFLFPEKFKIFVTFNTKTKLQIFQGKLCELK